MYLLKDRHNHRSPQCCEGKFIEYEVFFGWYDILAHVDVAPNEDTHCAKHRCGLAEEEKQDVGRCSVGSKPHWVEEELYKCVPL